MPYSQPNSFSKSSKLKEQNSKKKKKSKDRLAKKLLGHSNEFIGLSSLQMVLKSTSCIIHTAHQELQ